MPLALETYGRWGKDLIMFFKNNVLAGWQKSGQHILSIIKEYWKKRISVTLQLMNARMFLQRVDRIIKHPTAVKGGKRDESHFLGTFRSSWVRREDCGGF